MTPQTPLTTADPRPTTAPRLSAWVRPVLNKVPDVTILFVGWFTVQARRDDRLLDTSR